jgi:hypothetical protein
MKNPKNLCENRAVFPLATHNAALGTICGFSPHSQNVPRKREGLPSSGRVDCAKTNQALLSDLARVRALFQLRTIEAVIRGSM